MSRLLVVLRRVGRPIHRMHRPSPRLADCERCGSDRVNPVRWEERGETRWWIRLRCGECAFVREVTVGDEDAARFDRELDLGMNAIARELARLERERMTAEADVLTTALERDLIDADDFAR